MSSDGGTKSVPPTQSVQEAALSVGFTNVALANGFAVIARSNLWIVLKNISNKS